jgi:hypothetical protein
MVGRYRALVADNVDPIEHRGPDPDHPIRRIRRVIEEVLAELDSEFEAMYSRIGRPSVPPERRGGV